MLVEPVKCAASKKASRVQSSLAGTVSRSTFPANTSTSPRSAAPPTCPCFPPLCDRRLIVCHSPSVTFASCSRPRWLHPVSVWQRMHSLNYLSSPFILKVSLSSFFRSCASSLTPLSQVPYTSTAFMSSSTFGASTGLHLQMHTPPPLPAPSQYCGPYRLEDILPLDMLNLIITLFFDFVYPLTPCIHKPSFMVDLAAGREERDPLFFSLVMSTVASTLVQVPRSYVPMERSTVSELARKCYEASRFVTVATYDPPSSMYVVIRYL